MKGTKYLVTLAAVALATQPASAADYSEGAHPHFTGGFAGATLKLAMNRSRNKDRVPRLQLGVGISQTLHYAGSAAVVHIPGIELSFTSTAKPLLLVGGQSPSSGRHRLGITTGTALLVVGGLAAGALAIGTMSGGGSNDDELDRRQCFLPEKELCR